MKENIYYSSPEGQEFQGIPHVSLMPSLEFGGTWRVDLRWREDTSSSSVDAQFNFVDGIDFYSALEDANEYGKILNIPVASYNPVSIGVLFNPEREASKDQEKRLQFLMHSSSTQKFPTH